MGSYLVHYPYKGGSTCRLEADSEEAAAESFRSSYPQCKITKIEEVMPMGLRRSPACITADRLTWDDEGRLAWVFGFWAKNVKFYADVPPKFQDIFETRYRLLFSVAPEPKIGLYNISQDVQKWAVEMEIVFPVTDRLPPELERQQTAHPGKIARVQLFWALMEHGFELSETQDIDRIRLHVPEQQREFFDKGIKGE